MKPTYAASRRQKINLVLCATVMAAALPAAADVRLPKIFTDNMMLQRDLPVRVWGWADAGEAVSVTLAGKEARTKADEDGRWALELPAMKAGEKLELEVKGINSLTLKNVIVGDLWVCSGQSNMEMGLGGCLGAEEDIKAADLPMIRRIKFNHVQSAQPEPDAPTATSWQVCSPETAGGFTAVGFYFARVIQEKTGVPIGIVDVNWGGTPIEPWVATEGLALVDELKPAYVARQEAIKGYRAGLPEDLVAMEEWISRTRGDLASGTETSSPPAMPVHPGGSGWSGMYNAMIAPIVRFPIKGALWYQGESNGNEGETYYHKKQALVGGWRQQWAQGDFPFYFVQLANFQGVSEDPAGGNGWAKLREAQSKSLSIPNTGMAVIIDTVPLAEAGDIHPRNKYDVGTRLASWALGRDYGQKDVVVSGPLFKALKIEGNTARLTFEHTGTGLMAGKKEGRSPAVEAKGEKLKHFAVAGADKKWFWADAVIVDETVSVSSPEVKEPVAVRYAFQMNPDGANLYNREGLPASPFRTDDW
ncbi:MAG: sialate O-acetylesterase [Verrucomicrobia bacterium]|nr:sialate O-acetylesterase [Verrucomicrobiota bacterium]MDA1004920.1 sialate O-acetylesterase [Verrucomicrobiota bacterium]